MVITPQAIIITVPPVGGETLPQCGSALDNPITNRKRRLSNLSSEEKLHRKKLKNRVAAQTSRDKKKAHMEELESANALLSAQLEKLSSESEILRLHNSALSTENELLKQQLKDAHDTTSAMLGNIQERKCTCGRSSLNITTDSDSYLSSSSSRPAESLDHPQQKDLLADMGTEDLPDLCDLERLAESLLQDALEIAGKEGGNAEQMVGQTSEDVESSRFGHSSSLKLRNNEVPTVQIIPNTLPSAVTHLSKKTQKRNSLRTHSRLESPKANVTLSDSSLALNKPCNIITSDRLSEVAVSSLYPDDCITIVIPSSEEGDSCVFLGEAVQEVTTSTTHLLPSGNEEPLSPHSDIAETVKSDCGYESLDSPHSDITSSDMADVWNENFSELFPVLA